MKILIDGRFWGLENAGLGRYTANLVGGLGKIDSKNKYSIMLREKYFNRINLPNNWKKILVDIKHYSLTEQIMLPKIINKINPDLVHFIHFNVPILYHGKYVVTIFDMLMHKRSRIDSTLNSFSYFIKRVGYKFIFNRAVKNSRKIIVDSKFVQDQLARNYEIPAGKIVVTHLGVFDFGGISHVDVVKKYKINSPYFIYAGNAYSHKNLVNAIYGVVKLAEKRKDSPTFVIVSSRNVFTERLMRYIDSAGLQKYVKVINAVSDSDLVSLYKNSVAFLFPSISEGFGLPGIEAMKAGTILTCSDIPVFREVYEDNAIYFDPKNPSSIEEALEKTCNLTEKDRKVRLEKAREFVKRYSWSKMAKETLKIYESCLSL